MRDWADWYEYGLDPKDHPDYEDYHEYDGDPEHDALVDYVFEMDEEGYLADYEWHNCTQPINNYVPASARAEVTSDSIKRYLWSKSARELLNSPIPGQINTVEYIELYIMRMESGIKMATESLADLEGKKSRARNDKNIRKFERFMDEKRGEIAQIQKRIEEAQEQLLNTRNRTIKNTDVNIIVACSLAILIGVLVLLLI